jgi:uncharacterized protein
MSELAAREAALGLLNLSPANSSTILSSTSSIIPAKRKQDLVDFESEGREQQDQPEAISCICGYSHDDGFQVGCDSCLRWVHAMCFGIGSTNVPEKWFCWTCQPRRVDGERAARYQREYLRTLMAEKRAHSVKQRRPSPGNHHSVPAPKPRKSSGSDHKRKRRQSVAEEEHTHVDIMTEDEPWKDPRMQRLTPQQATTTVTTTKHRQTPSMSVHDLVHPTHTSPRQYARRPLPASSPESLYPSIGHGRPSLHATQSQRHQSADRHVADPLDSYVHQDMPKPVVNLSSPLSDMTINSRYASRRQPNAVLRPAMCRQPGEPPSDSLSFTVHALRNLRADEEIVLGWEWDDGQALHSLPANIEAPSVFP